MPNYMFNLGNSTDGQIGAVMRVIADSKLAALAIIKEALASNWAGGTDNRTLRVLDADGNRDQRVEYFNVYFNPEAITLADLDDSMTEDDDETCPDCGEQKLGHLYVGDGVPSCALVSKS